MEEVERISRERPLTEIELKDKNKAEKKLTIIYPAEPEKEAKPRYVRSGTVLAETVVTIPANKVVKVESMKVTQKQIDMGVACHITQQGQGSTDTYWILSGEGSKYKTDKHQEILNIHTPGPYLELKGGNKKTTVKIQLIYTGKKPGRTSSGF